MDIKTVEEKLNVVYDKAMKQEVPELQVALQALGMMPKDQPQDQVKIVDCDDEGNITIDLAGLTFGKEIKDVSVVNYVVKGSNGE